MSQEKIKVLLDKINLLVNVFMKDGIERVSTLEKDLLTEQVQELLREVQSLALKESSIEQITSNRNVQVIEPDKQVEVEGVIEEKADEPQNPKLNTQEKSVAESKDYSSNKPQRSIKEVIDLNKSFILKADLFANDQSAYSSFIQSLEKQESEKASFALLDAKKQEMNWDEEDKAYQLLARAIEKRFLPLLHQ
jgi:hypothetical protein